MWTDLIQQLGNEHFSTETLVVISIGLGLALLSVLAILAAWAFSGRIKNIVKTRTRTVPAARARQAEIEAMLNQMRDAQAHHQAMLNDMAERLNALMAHFQASAIEPSNQTHLSRAMGLTQQLGAKVNQLHQQGLMQHAKALNQSLASDEPQAASPWEDWLSAYQDLQAVLASLVASMQDIQNHHDRPHTARFETELKTVDRLHQDLKGLSQSVTATDEMTRHAQTLVRRHSD